MINNIKNRANTVTNKAKVTLEENLTVVRSKAKELNTTAFEAGNEIVDDVVEKSKLVGATILKVTKSNVEQIDFSKRINGVKESVSKANNFVLETTESAIEAGFENTKKWQSIGEKAINGSLEIAERQQTIIFDNLDVLKNQFSNSYNRIRAIF